MSESEPLSARSPAVLDPIEVPDPYPVEPLAVPPDATIAVPGSKSITNRALVCAALADGVSMLDGVLFADDTEAMLGVLGSLGIGVRANRRSGMVEVDGCGGELSPGPVDVDVRQSGTTARFVTPMLALGRGPYHVTGRPQLLDRPMGPTFDALRRLGGAVDELGIPGHLPVRVVGPPLRTSALEVPGDVSSQFLSGLLLMAPCLPEGLELRPTASVVSRPYIALTLAVMRAFGATIDIDDATLIVAPGGYRAADHVIEPDASTASYFWAAAAITGGRVRVSGLGRAALQGDMGFVDLLERMGATVDRGDSWTEVAGSGTLHGIDADLSDISDTAPTLAAVAVFADSPTRIRGIGFIRRKETDRVAAVEGELRRCGIAAVSEPDGWVITPGRPTPAVIQTHDDHRLAMSFSLLGLRTPGIAIQGPACVAKTFPGYWAAFEGLRR